MASSDVEVCSNALVRIGASPVASLDEAGDGAVLMKRFYLPTLRSRLREHAWNFAQYRVELAELADEPVWDFAHQFQLPQDPYCLYLLETDLEDNEAWRIETFKTTTSQYRVLVTDSASVKILYVGLVEDVNLWDDLFVDAMEVELAWKAAYPLTRNATLLQELDKERERAWRKARSRDGQEARALKKMLSTSLTTDVR